MRNISNPLRLIELLSDGQCHSGEELAAVFGITRAGVNKYIKLIRQWGIELSSVPGKGYRLQQRLDILKYAQIEQHYIQQTSTPLQLDLIPVIDSTNQYLLDRIANLASGDACVAEYQQAGRGRRGRKWFSPFGSNLYLSMYWRLEQGPAAAMGLSLAIGIVMAKVLSAISEQEIKVKWPNDLYLNDKKLAGILVEITGKTGDLAHIVIGIGINLSMKNPNQDVVNQAWSNLGNLDRNSLVAHLLYELRSALYYFEQQGFSAFLPQWQQFDNFANRTVKLIMGDNVVEGIARGINQQGALLLEQDGVIKPYIGGEISLRGVDKPCSSQ